MKRLLLARKSYHRFPLSLAAFSMSVATQRNFTPDMNDTRDAELPRAFARDMKFFWILALIPGLVFAEMPSQSAAAANPGDSGLRVFTVGHSFHAWVAPIVAELTEEAGIKNHQVAGVMMVGGSTVLKCWNLPNAREKNPTNPDKPLGNTAREALTAGNVDVLTLSPIWLPDEGIENFTALGLKKNPNLRVLVQEFWLPNDTYEPVYPLNVRKTPTVDHNAVVLPELKKNQEKYLSDLEKELAALNKKFGRNVISIVPVGQATLALREKIAAGQAPGIEKQAELFGDPWGHPTMPLKVLSAYCHFAVIYGRSPVGLPMPKELKGKYRNDELNRLLQELAWQAVTTNPMSGVKP
jgi:hypothetical protein